MWSDLPAAFSHKHLSSRVDGSEDTNRSVLVIFQPLLTYADRKKSNALTVTSLYDTFVVGRFNLSTGERVLCLD